MAHSNYILETTGTSIKFRIRENTFLSRVAAWKLNAKQVAIVWGSTIHLHNTSSDEFLSNQRWLQHELKHLEQFRQHGFVPFLFKYFWEFLIRGYYNNRFEVEARNAEKSVQ